jgi:hypothetical protein
METAVHSRVQVGLLIVVFLWCAQNVVFAADFFRCKVRGCQARSGLCWPERRPQPARLPLIRLTHLLIIAGP